jgi:uncharacterized membrane protein YphA (DoxX/SURF4 family)
MSTHRKGRRVALWILQSVLAALFLFAGGFKLATPVATLATFSPLSGAFLKFIGLCEVAGALGLVLPGLLRLKTGLTPIAAAGLVIIMIGATVVTATTQGAAPAILPFAVGVLLCVVIVGRWPGGAHAVAGQVRHA